MARADRPVARLVWVLDGEVRFGHAGPNRAAVDAVVSQLRADGAINDVDEAQATAAVMLGEAVDSDPTNAALWAQYRAALEAVKGLGAGGDDDAFARLVAELGSPAVRHTKEPEQAD